MSFHATAAPARSDAPKQTMASAPPTSILRRKCACGGNPGAAGECAACKKKKLTGGATLQRKLAIGSASDPAEREADAVANRVMRMPSPGLGQNPVGTARPVTVQRRTGGGTGGEGHAPPIVHNVLSAPGRPLGAGTRSFFEPRFGTDLSHVRVHTDGRSAESAKAVNATAYTVGHNVVFGRGAYAPGSDAGRRLMAHELAHVGQQGGAIAGGTSAPRFLRRVCGPDAIGSRGGCVGSSADISDFGVDSGNLFRFKAGCDELTPVDEARLGEMANELLPDEVIKIHGFASEEGDPAFNDNLSCARAQAVSLFLTSRGISAAKVQLFSHGATPGDRVSRRSVVVEWPPSKPKPSDSDKKNKKCTPAPGIPPSNCTAYSKNESWLPDAYVSNATCACEETPDSPTANCVRKFLQDRLAATPDSLKNEAELAKDLSWVTGFGLYTAFVLWKLTPMIHQDHVDAYKHCCCPCGPASYSKWVGVTTVPISSCALVGIFIRQFGPCHCISGKW